MELGRAPIVPEASFMCVICGRRSSDTIYVPSVVVRVFCLSLPDFFLFYFWLLAACCLVLFVVVFYFVKYAFSVCSTMNCLQQGFKAVCAVPAPICLLSNESCTFQTSYSLALCNGLKSLFYIYISTLLFKVFIYIY